MNLQAIILRYNIDSLVADIEALSAKNDDGKLNDLIKRKMDEAYYAATLLEGQGIHDMSLRSEYV